MNCLLLAESANLPEKVHSHKNRPAVFYVIQGETTITYGDGTVKRFPADSMGFANKDTVHWHQNNEKEPVVFVAGDIFQPKKDNMGSDSIRKKWLPGKD